MPDSEKKYLEQRYSFIWLILAVLTQGLSTFFLGLFLDVYDSDAWYADMKTWVIAALLFVFPVFILLAIFSIQITVEVCKKLKVPGEEIYGNLYIWIILLIFPIIGWGLLAILQIYITIMPYVRLIQGYGERLN